MTATRIIDVLVVANLMLGCSSESPERPVRTDHRVRASPIPKPAAKPVRVDPPAASGAMAPNLAVSGDSLLAIWIEPGATDQNTRLLRFARFRKGQWTAPVTIVSSDSMFSNWADIPTVKASADGKMLIAHWARRSGPATYAYDVALARSADGGKAWRNLGTAHRDGTKTEHGFVSLVGEGAGVRAFWLDGRNTQKAKNGARGAMTLRTAHVGLQVGDSTSIDARVCDCCGTDAAQTSAGPVIVYRNRSQNEIRDIWIVRRRNNTWTTPAAVHADGWRMPGCPVNGPAVAARGKRVAVAWFTYADKRPTVRVAFSRDAGASFDPPIIVDQPRDKVAPIGRVDIVLSGQNEVIVTWMATGRGRADILARRVRRDGKTSEAIALASTSAQRSAGFPRLARLNNDLLLVWTGPSEPSRLLGLKLPLAHIPAATRRSSSRRATPHARLLALGAKLPAYTARDLKGVPTSLNPGKPILLNVWATWCQPCRREIPQLSMLHQQNAKRGLRVIGVSIDGKVNTKRVNEFSRRARIPYPVWLDHDDRASQMLGVGIVPATFLFDARGTLVWRHVGPVRANDPTLRKALERLLTKR